MDKRRVCTTCGHPLDYFDLPEGPRWLCEYCEMMIPALVREQLLARIDGLEIRVAELVVQLEAAHDAQKELSNRLVATTEELVGLQESWEDERLG